MLSLGSRRAAVAATATLMLSALAGAQTGGSGVGWCEDPHEPDCTGCGKAAMHARRVAAGLPTSDERLEQPAEALGDTDLLHVNLDLEVLPATTSLAGVCTLTVRSLVNNLTQFTFRLRNNLTITSATIGGAAVSVATPSTTTRVATLDRAYSAGETFAITIAYNGPAVSRGFGSIEFQTTPGGDPVVATLSEAFYAYTWWPSKEGDVGQPGDMTDKATFELAITAPANLTSVANGMLQGVDVLSGNRRRFRWATAYPQAVYLAAFGSTVYNQYTQTHTFPGGGTMPFDMYLYPASDTPANRAVWATSLPALDVLGEIFGQYPFANEKYGIYQFPFGGGMEHQTMTGMGSFSESITVHELAHQWWGDHVTCRTWSDIWLNEGFATYSEALWFERKPGSTGLPALHSAMASRRPTAVSGTVYRYDTTSNTPIFSGNYSYRKGGWVLHMLRKVVGDQTFFDILAGYRAAFAGSAATTDDFKGVAAAVSGRNLDTFFQQWVYNGGAPAYAFGFQPVTVNGSSYVKVHVRQTQNNSAFGVGGVFDMPLDVRIDTAGGTVTRTVRNDALTDWFVLAAPAPVTGAALDEFNWVLATEKVTETYLAGPPVVVETAPAPGALVPAASAPAAIDVFFSDPVTTSAGHYALVGPGGAVPFTFAYSAGLQRARLTPGAPLAAGTYTLTIGPGVVAATGGLALDGEVSSGALPSGDGAAGGAAVITFAIEPSSCPADFNGDGNLDPDDLSDYITCFFSVPACAGADYNGDENVDPDDLSDYITAFFAGCP